MLTARRGDRRPPTSTDGNAPAGAIIIPRGDTAVTMPTAMPTATPCSPTGSHSTVATSSSASSAAPTTASTPATTTPAMRERGPYRQGGDGESERKHSKHCHVGTAFLRPEIGTRTTERAASHSRPPSARPPVVRKHHACHVALVGPAAQRHGYSP